MSDFDNLDHFEHAFPDRLLVAAVAAACAAPGKSNDGSGGSGGSGGSSGSAGETGATGQGGAAGAGGEQGCPCTGGLLCCPTGDGGVVCVDMAHDPHNCGACGNGCAPGDTCQEGMCG
ncbi:MAG: hypothetical protein HY744_17100 [Deltaproteobacteria bacterium]|nr:hypothetical protein [Deltaproteobacteria bacterium]